ncbi:hypothetical protein EDD11_001910 [Mortierella claussenii]|nr:hypothetical protein EDD11_001910 [Mortierella claussenii]
MHILIVGGGIGGLMLGIMLERAGISYQILERSPEHRPLGSAISLNGTVLRLFEQLGLLEELHKISKFAGRLHLVKEDLETQGHIDLEHFRESVVFGRPDLFKMLVSHIPSHKLLMSKRILSTSQTELGVLVRCSDGSTFHGDVLVGADGAYSSIRQCMHKSLKEKGLLPKSDSEQLKFDQHCVVGITNELDPERYPILKEDYCELFGVIGKKRPYTIWLIPITGNRFAWSIGGRVPDSEVGQEDVRSFSFAEWWPELATDVCDLVRNYTLPDFKVLYHHDEHYKTTRPEAVAADSEIHDHSHHDEGDEDEEESDGRCSVHSGALSDTSPVSSSASSAMTDGPTARYRRQRPHQCQHPHQNGSASSSAAKGNSAHLLPPTNPMRQTHSSSVLSFTSSAESAQTSTPKRSTTVPPPPTRPGTVAEIIDATNTDRISKVMLESKMFKVWHHERTVLIGDACHKVLPFAGQGAIQAILDGISLANALYDMKTNSIDDITKAFKRYSHERIPIAKAAVTGSRSFGKLLNVQGKVTDFIRKISFSRVPNWVLRMATDRLHLYRPQLTYLPMVPDRGVAKAYKQDYSPRCRSTNTHRDNSRRRRIESVGARVLRCQSVIRRMPWLQPVSSAVPAAAVDITSIFTTKGPITIIMEKMSTTTKNPIVIIMEKTSTTTELPNIRRSIM